MRNFVLLAFLSFTSFVYSQSHDVYEFNASSPYWNSDKPIIELRNDEELHYGIAEGGEVFLRMAVNPIGPEIMDVPQEAKSNVKKVSCKINNVCVALKEDSTIVTWGYSWTGDPVAPSGLNDIVDIYYEKESCIYVFHADGKYSRWGDECTSLDKASDLQQIVYGNTPNSYTVTLDQVYYGGALLYPRLFPKEHKIISAPSFSGVLGYSKKDKMIYEINSNHTIPQMPDTLFNVEAYTFYKNNLIVLNTDGTIKFIGDTTGLGFKGIPQGIEIKSLSGYLAITTSGQAISMFDGYEFNLGTTQGVKSIGMSERVTAYVLANGSVNFETGYTKIIFGIADSIKQFYSQRRDIRKVALDPSGYYCIAITIDNTLIANPRPHFMTEEDVLSIGKVKDVAMWSDVVYIVKESGEVVVFNSDNYNYYPVLQPPVLSDVKKVYHSSHTSGGGGYWFFDTDNGVALKEDGTLVIWGGNDYGQLTLPSSMGNVIDVATFGQAFLALNDNGEVFGWGNNANGLLNIPQGLSDVVSIAVGLQHAVAVKSDGSVVTWGDFNPMPQSNVAISSAYAFYLNTVMLSTSSTGNNGSIVSGSVLRKTTDCTTGEPNSYMKGIVLSINDGDAYTSTDRDGNYNFYLDSTQTSFYIKQHQGYANKHVALGCNETIQVDLQTGVVDTCCFNFYNELKYCSQLTISIANDNRERCFKSKTVVDYCNTGTEDAQNTAVQVTYPQHLIPLSSTPSWTKREGNILYYDKAVLAKQQCEKIIITDSVSCASTDLLGLTQCVEAEISPVSTCRVVNASFDGSEVAVDASCKDGVVTVDIQNRSTKKMSKPSQYRVYVNDTLIHTDLLQLDGLTVQPIDYPALGNTVRLEVDQVENFPDVSTPVITVEGCKETAAAASTIVKGFVTGTQDDAESEKAVSCSVIIGSFDPNDKQAQPKGITDKNYVKAGTPIHYTIRFQNTGSAPARKVIVVDTLDANLDISTFTEGASSHNYTLAVSGKGKPVLTFTFNNINLPDSTTDALASNGFVGFSIASVSTTADETEINNEAGIYFDFNEPIITNNVMHTIGEPMLEDLSKGINVVAKPQVILGTTNALSTSISLYPNPSKNTVRVMGIEDGELVLKDITGRERLNISITTETISIEGLTKGFYLYEIRKGSEVLQQGKLIKE